MHISKAIALLFFSLCLSFYTYAQKVILLNNYKYPIQNTLKYEPCFYSVETTTDDSTITEIFSIDSLLVSKIELQKNHEGDEIKKVTREFGDNEILKSTTEEDYLLNFKIVSTFYENGQLESKEIQKGEEIEKGEYFDKDGLPRNEFIKISPEPKDGLTGFYKYLSKTLSYPKKARRSGIQGMVYLVFEITEEGTIENLEAMNPEDLDESMVDEALKVVWKYPHLWIPGKLDGEIVRVRMRLPVNFRL